MSRRLPNELFDNIISRVPAYWGLLSLEERETLLNCTLVCRDWLPASRHALFSSVRFQGPTSWDSFLRYVVHAEEGRPWLTSILRLGVDDRWLSHYEAGKPIPAHWRGYYVIPVLAGHLPNLEHLLLSVNWDLCQPHPSTFGMLSQFPSLRELRLFSCHFPSFCTFRRILVSLPALKTLVCEFVHWPSSPQPYILGIPSSPLALQSLKMFLPCRSCTLTVLEWLIHTPMCSTLLDLSLRCEPLRDSHPIILPHRTLNYYVQIFAPSLHKVHLVQIQSKNNIADNISDLSRFSNLRSLQFTVNGRDWQGVADLLQSLPAQLDKLVIHVRYDEELVDSDSGTVMVKDEREVKAMLKTNGLELLEPVLLRDNFKALRYLEFSIYGYHDTLESLQEKFRQMLPKLYSRATLNIRLELFCFVPLSLLSPAAEHSAQMLA